MIVYINGRKAAVKAGTSFDFVAENPLFSGREEYTLSIVFPLKGCPANIDIFGWFIRFDWRKQRLTFDCSIVSGRFRRTGVLTVVKASEVEIECQFAAGKSREVVEDPFEDTYINKLDIGAPGVRSPDSVSAAECWRSIDSGATAVALPWVNSEYPTVHNNWVKYDEDKRQFVWDGVLSLSWQPYLLHVAEAICAAVGYTPEFGPWRRSRFRHLLMCNTLPASWGISAYARALPAWTVTEFFENLGLFLCCDFSFDHFSKTVSMEFTEDSLAHVEPVCLESIVDSFTVELNDPEQQACSYIGTRRILYKDVGHQLSPYFACDWFVCTTPLVVEYDNMDQMIERNKARMYYTDGKLSSVRYGHPTDIPGYDRGLGSVNCLLFCRAENTYFVFRSIGTTPFDWEFENKEHYYQNYVLQPVNVFGAGFPETDGIESEELEFVPVCVDDTEVGEENNGRMMFLSPGSVDGEGNEWLDPDGNPRPGNMGNMGQDKNPLLSPAPIQPTAAKAIEEGEAQEKSANYQTIFVGFFTGALPQPQLPPYPLTDTVAVTKDWKKLYFPECGLRRSEGQMSFYKNLTKIDPYQKTSFSWIADDIPDPRAIFHIRGCRYVCEKITATFSDTGMSNLLKGEFYPVVD